MSSIHKNIFSRSLIDIFMVWKYEFSAVFHNMGVMVFFLLLPTAYPIVYGLIYNTELVREVPVVVVDDARTPLSREFTRNVDATQNINIISYCANLQEAKRLMNEKECYGILYLPKEFSQKIGRGEVADLCFFSDMSLLIRYRGFLVALTNVVVEMGAKLQTANINEIAPGLESMTGNPAPSFSITMGNPEQGFATFLMPGILVLILQQSLILGICLLGANERERIRKIGVDAVSIKTGIFNTMIGKALCYYTVYIIPTIYILHFVPIFFSFPVAANMEQIFIFITPYLFASIFLGMTLQVFVRERESSFLVIVFSSIIFLFLSGLSWPRYAMNSFWYLISDCIPAVWAMEGFVRMNSNGSTLEQTSHQYLMLWLLTVVYFIIAYSIYRWIDRRPRY
ncbi:MAG: ABC transporter permease [Muribaculaceae bacterium]